MCERWQACSLPRLPGNPRHTCASTPASPGSPGAAPTAHKQAPDPCEPSAGAGPPPQKLPVAGGLAAARPRRGGYTDRPRARSRSAAFLPTLTPSDHLQHGPGPRKLQEAALPFVLHRAVAPPPPPLPPSVAPAGRCPRLPAMCSSKPHPGRAHCPVHSLGGRGGRGSEPRALWPACCGAVRAASARPGVPRAPSPLIDETSCEHHCLTASPGGRLTRSAKARTAAAAAAAAALMHGSRCTSGRFCRATRTPTASPPASRGPSVS